METLWQDLRYGARQLLRSPGFTVVAVLTLALGIGANAAVFSLVNAFVLRPLPLEQPDRLVLIATRRQDDPSRQLPVFYAEFRDWREAEAGQTFEGMAAYREGSFNFEASEAPERVSGCWVSYNLFSVLRVRPVHGRVFVAEDERPGAARVAIVGHTLARRLFGADGFLPGRSVKLDGEIYTVVGVMPSDFGFPEFSDLWIPASSGAPEILRDRTNREFEVVGRLRPDVALGRAQAQMDIIARRLALAFPETNQGIGLVVRPFGEIREEGKEAFPLMFGAVGLVLLIACSNVGNLLLARAAARHKEIAMRVALGASRPRIVRQLLTEGLLLSLGATMLGVLLAVWAMDLMTAAIPVQIPYWLRVELDARVLLFTLGCCLLTTLLFGLGPALQASRPSLREAMQESAARGGSPRQRRLRRLLVVFEISLAVSLITAAGLMTRGLARLGEFDLGYDSRDVWRMRVELPHTQYPDEVGLAAFQQRLLDRVARIPEIQLAASSGSVPNSGQSFTLKETPTGNLQEARAVQMLAVSTEYFQLLKIPLVKGRSFTDADGPESESVVIVNRALAEQFWPGQEPLGKVLKLGGPTTTSPWRTIVGIVGDVRQLGLYRAGVEARGGPALYVPFHQVPARSLAMYARTTRPAGLETAVSTAVAELDSRLPVFGFESLERSTQIAVSPLRALTDLLSIFGACGLFLASIGVYGVVSYSVAQQTNEIGIRVALGAQPRQILRLVLSQALGMVLTGIGLGLLIASGLTRFLQSLLFGTRSTDPLTFASVALLLAAVALLACWVPARRAMRVDPMVALRYE